MKWYLKKVREQKNISLRQLAKKSGVSKNHIEKIENGNTNPSVEVMCRLAKALDVPVYTLFSCED